MRAPTADAGRRRDLTPSSLPSATRSQGWEAHNAEVDRVRKQFEAYLAGPHKSGKQVSLNRSRGGVADSNRTIHPVYKVRAARPRDCSSTQR